MKKLVTKKTRWSEHCKIKKGVSATLLRQDHYTNSVGTPLLLVLSNLVLFPLSHVQLTSAVVEWCVLLHSLYAAVGQGGFAVGDALVTHPGCVNVADVVGPSVGRTVNDVPA